MNSIKMKDIVENEKARESFLLEFVDSKNDLISPAMVVYTCEWLRELELVYKLLNDEDVLIGIELITPVMKSPMVPCFCFYKSNGVLYAVVMPCPTLKRGIKKGERVNDFEWGNFSCKVANTGDTFFTNSLQECIDVIAKAYPIGKSVLENI